MSILARLLVHTATVEPYEGGGAYGDVYGDPFQLPCYYEGVRQLVRARDGSEVVSEGTLYANPTDSVTPGSKVNILGRDTWVLSVSTFDDGGMTGLAHIAVALA